MIQWIRRRYANEPRKAPAIIADLLVLALVASYFLSFFVGVD